MVSFGDPFFNFQAFLFPSAFTNIQSAFVAAPFWSDVDIRTRGNISYEVHTAGSNAQSDMLLARVNDFILNVTQDDHAGTWMLVAHWNAVPTFPGTAPEVMPV